MRVDLAELRRLHEAATPGPWLHKVESGVKNQRIESAEVVMMLDEIERLRRVLQKILAQATPCGYDYGNGEIAKMVREALEGR